MMKYFVSVRMYVISSCLMKSYTLSHNYITDIYFCYFVICINSFSADAVVKQIIMQTEFFFDC